MSSWSWPTRARIPSPCARPANTRPTWKRPRWSASFTAPVETCPDLEKVDTPDTHTVEEVAALLEIDPEKVVKTLLFDADGEPVAALVRGDRELNEIKFKNLTGATMVETGHARAGAGLDRRARGLCRARGAGTRSSASTPTTS